MNPRTPITANAVMGMSVPLMSCYITMQITPLEPKLQPLHPPRTSHYGELPILITQLQVFGSTN